MKTAYHGVIIIIYARFAVMREVPKVEATPCISVSVHVSVFRIRVRYFDLHLTAILCPLSGGFYLIGSEYSL